MNTTEHVLAKVCQHFNVTVEDLRGDRRFASIAEARKIAVHLMYSIPSDQIALALNRSRHWVYHYRTVMNHQSTSCRITQNHIQAIQQLDNQMTIKLNRSQLASLYEVLELFLQMKPESTVLELVCLMLFDVKEKARKRFLSGKENIGFDEKQAKAFIIWYAHLAHELGEKNPHIQMTLVDIINQLKPIENGQDITASSKGKA